MLADNGVPYMYKVFLFFCFFLSNLTLTSVEPYSNTRSPKLFLDTHHHHYLPFTFFTSFLIKMSGPSDQKYVKQWFWQCCQCGVSINLPQISTHCPMPECRQHKRCSSCVTDYIEVRNSVSSNTKSRCYCLDMIADISLELH